MNISNKALSEQQSRSLLYRQIFFVLFFLLQVGCVKLSVGCDIDNIDIDNKRAALEECKENPNVTVKGEF